MMGITRTGLSEEEQSISDALTKAYADYINSLGLTDAEGNALTLEESEDGRYQAGSYYEYMKGIIEESLNRLVPGILFGIRIYNLKNIFNPVRVKNPAVPLFLHEQGNIYLGTPDDKYMKYLFNSGIYKTSEYIK